MDEAGEMTPQQILEAQKTRAEARGVSLETFQAQVAAREVRHQLTEPGSFFEDIFFPPRFPD